MGGWVGAGWGRRGAFGDVAEAGSPVARGQAGGLLVRTAAAQKSFREDTPNLCYPLARAEENTTQSEARKEGNSRVVARLRVRAVDLGLPSPPEPLRLAFQVRDNQVVVIVQAPGAGRRTVRQWVDALEPRDVIERGDDDLVHLWATFEPVPKRWAEIVNLFELRTVRVEPTGEAEVALVGPRSEVLRVIEGAHFSGVEVLGVEAVDPSTRHVLTERQQEAAEAALRSGYYEVPRGLSLTMLADRIGVSPSALSELLRRAEGRALAALLGGPIHEAGNELSGADEEEEAGAPGAPSETEAIEDLAGDAGGGGGRERRWGDDPSKAPA